MYLPVSYPSGPMVPSGTLPLVPTSVSFPYQSVSAVYSLMEFMYSSDVYHYTALVLTCDAYAMLSLSRCQLVVSGQ